jgi:hypothetical protein
MKDGTGAGEGLVVKNYDYINQFGRATWAKIVTNEFKEKNAKEFGTEQKSVNVSVEEKIIDNYFTEAFIEKEYSKMVLNEPWSSRRIPELLGRMWHEFVDEESVNFVKSLKNPTINFKVLNNLATQKIKRVRGDLF